MLGARAPTQPDGLAFADQNTFQATLDERTCGYGVWVRRIQYIAYRKFACCLHLGHSEVFLMATVQKFLATSLHSTRMTRERYDPPLG
jgi:hypothetical protein